MANPNSLPLYEKYWYKHNYKRVLDSFILILLLLLLGYRIISINNYSFHWFVALICELWFTLSWVFTISTQWNPALIKTYPHLLLQSVQELPPVDLFVTTADDELEPPIITMNTVLSLLALDYPSHKLACYVSDDGCSPLIFYALQESSKFAKHWVPFCKKYKIQVRAPFRYFCDDECTTNNEEFNHEWLRMKRMYENLSHKIEVDPKSIPSLLEGEFDVFSNTQRTNHPTIIKVIWENKEMVEDGLPHLIYISREKRPKQPHHFKAGAMNVLYLGAGLAGLQGIFYGGTNCFHRRKVIYGLSPDDVENEGRIYSPNDINVTKAVEEATQVACYGYEYGTGWGKQVGWIYGSITEDVLTGLTIHKKGWRSELCTPDPVAFRGCAPIGGPTSMAQHKRWATGMLEIFFSKHCPIFGTIFGKLSFRQFLAYMWIMNWGFNPVALVCYSCLLPYCIITNSNFLPKDWGICIPIALIVTYMVYTLVEYLISGMTIRAWWNNQRMSLITPMNAGFCGFITILLKLLGISNTIFDITKKDIPSSSDEVQDKDASRHTFDKSLVFLPGTTILLLQLTSIFIKLFGFQPQGLSENYECGVAEMLCSVYWIMSYWPFLRGLFERGKYGIPFSTIRKGAAMTCLFVFLCRSTISS
ncbi:cellulose synthase-like protein B4 isoform X5 [Cicer arietinum]|uniref:cellulose synthase-like protein B4 isoform X5 n=1 Tax=Cicer arietinum TaxID=3827 RepID=UPI003CC6987E